MVNFLHRQRVIKRETGMRLAACALSTVLLSGCSWFGVGGHGEIYGYDNSGYGYNSGTYGQHAAYGGCGQTVVVTAAGCVPGQGYAMAQPAYGYSADVYGGATTLAAAAPYGAAVGTTVETVLGGGMYVDQSHAVVQGYDQGYGYAVQGHGGGYHGATGLRGGYGGGSGFAIEGGISTDVALGGDIFVGKSSEPFLGGPGHLSDLTPVSYADAFGNTTSYDLTATYKLNPKTTLLGQFGYSIAKGGEKVKIGTVDNGAGITEDLFAQYSDLKQFRFEGGVRHYLGRSSNCCVPARGLRPYVGATAGFTNVRDVELTQSSDTLVDPAIFSQNYVDGGWHPSASGVIGADWHVNSNMALGVETGLRWRDDVDSNIVSEDQWTVPLKLRGRMTF